VYQSNSSCYAIAGKQIELVVNPAANLPDSWSCSDVWIETLPSNPGCFVCFFGSVATTFVNETFISIMDVTNTTSVLLRSQAATILGDYKMFTDPRCNFFYFGLQPYQVGPDQIARVTYGDVVLTVANL
jgi:hypothetical protein